MATFQSIYEYFASFFSPSNLVLVKEYMLSAVKTGYEGFARFADSPNFSTIYILTVVALTLAYVLPKLYKMYKEYKKERSAGEATLKSLAGSMGKIYYKAKNFQVSEKGFFLVHQNEFTHPSKMTGEFETNFVSLPNKPRSFVLGFFGCFVASEATVSKAMLPEELAYIVSFILFVMAYYYWIRTEIYVDFILKNNDFRGVCLRREKDVYEFIDAMKNMLADYRKPPQADTKKKTESVKKHKSILRKLIE